MYADPDDLKLHPQFRKWLRSGQARSGARSPKLTVPIGICECGAAFLLNTCARPRTVCGGCDAMRNRRFAAASNARREELVSLGQRREEARKQAASWRTRNPGRLYKRGRELSREQKLHKFGLTIGDYDRLHEAQQGLCAICLRPELIERRLAVDHCHETGRVRGLLCAKCNTAIGKLGDSADLLHRAISYLRGEL